MIWYRIGRCWAWSVVRAGPYCISLVRNVVLSVFGFGTRIERKVFINHIEPEMRLGAYGKMPGCRGGRGPLMLGCGQIWIEIVTRRKF